MTLKIRLGEIADKLTPVAGALMQRACGDSFEHTEKCDCYTCIAFLATNDCINKLEAIIKEIKE